MSTLFWILKIILVGAVASAEPTEFDVNTSSLRFRPTSCEEFEEDSYFAPQDVVDSLWKIFYFWAKGMEISTILFSLPSEKKVNTFKGIVESIKPDIEVNWKNSALFMEPRPGVQVLLVSKGRVGAFLAVVKNEDSDKDPLLRKPHVHLTEVRMKIVGRYMAVINCDDRTAFTMARVAEMPSTNKACVMAAASFGLDTQHGKCYLSVQDLHHIIDEL
ncbi:uncharacterized protein [Battus philenor]|uniref:uncharacterized protein n=1 Tax=Battus philenor TaxID=42288 RepID=UPI0035D136E2